VERELEKYGGDLLQRERWLVFNKIDLIAADERTGRRDAVVNALRWTAPVHSVSAVTGEGCDELVAALMRRIQQLPAERDVSPADDETWSP
jgi:GTP-binding protein